MYLASSGVFRRKARLLVAAVLLITVYVIGNRGIQTGISSVTGRTVSDGAPMIAWVQMGLEESKRRTGLVQWLSGKTLSEGEMGMRIWRPHGRRQICGKRFQIWQRNRRKPLISLFGRSSQSGRNRPFRVSGSRRWEIPPGRREARHGSFSRKKGSEPARMFLRRIWCRRLCMRWHVYG